MMINRYPGNELIEPQVFPFSKEVEEDTVAAWVNVSEFDQRAAALLGEVIVGDEVLAEAVAKLSRGWRFPTNDTIRFMEGGAVMRYAMIAQAALSGLELPAMPRVVMLGYFDQIKGGTSGAAWISKISSKMEGDIAMQNIIKKCTEVSSYDDVGKYAFRFGAYAMYDLIKYQLETQDLESMFSYGQSS